MIPVKNTSLIPYLEDYFKIKGKVDFNIANIMQCQMFQQYLCVNSEVTLKFRLLQMAFISSQRRN